MLIQRNDNPPIFCAKEVKTSDLNKIGKQARLIIEGAVPKLYDLGDAGTYIHLTIIDDQKIVSIKNKATKKIEGFRIQSIPRLQIKISQEIETQRTKIMQTLDNARKFLLLKKMELPQIEYKKPIIIHRVKSEDQIIEAAKKRIENV